MDRTVFVAFCIVLSLQVSKIVCSSYPMNWNTAETQANNLAALSNLLSQTPVYPNNPTTNTLDPYLQQRYALLASLQPKPALPNVGYQATSSPLLANNLLNGLYQTVTPKQIDTLNGMQQTAIPKQTETLNGMQQSVTPKKSKKLNKMQQTATPIQTQTVSGGTQQITRPQQTQITESDVQEIVRNYINTGLAEVLSTMKVIVKQLFSVLVHYVSESIAENAMEEQDTEDEESHDDEEEMNTEEDESHKLSKHPKIHANHKGHGQHSSAKHGHQSKSQHHADSSSDNEEGGNHDDASDDEEEEEDSEDSHKATVNSGIIEQTEEGYEKQVDDNTKVTFLLRDNNVIRKVTERAKNKVQEEIFNNNVLIERKVDSKITKFDFPTPKETTETCKDRTGEHEKDVDLKLRKHTIPAKYITVMSKVTPEFIHFKIIDEHGYLYEEKYTTGPKGHLVLYKFNGETQCETPASP